MDSATEIESWAKGLWPRFKKFWFSDWFDPNQSFLRLPAFWGPVLVISLIAGVTYLKVIADQDLVFNPAGDIDQWYRWFQVPIWIFATLIPIVGLFNANHKSEQTKESMRLTGDQNRFANYYKHIEEFEKYIKSLNSTFGSETEIRARRTLHHYLYPRAREGDRYMDHEAMLDPVQIVQNLLDILMEIQVGARGTYFEALKKIEWLNGSVFPIQEHLTLSRSSAGLEWKSGYASIGDACAAISRFVAEMRLLALIYEFDVKYKYGWQLDYSIAAAESYVEMLTEHTGAITPSTDDPLEGKQLLKHFSGTLGEILQKNGRLADWFIR